MQAQYRIGPKTPEEQRAQAMREAARRELISRQNVLLGIVGGVLGAATGAVLWALVTVVTRIQIGFMAIGVGFLAGCGVWILGRGLSPLYGAIGAYGYFPGNRFGWLEPHPRKGPMHHGNGPGHGTGPGNGKGPR